MTCNDLANLIELRSEAKSKHPTAFPNALPDFIDYVMEFDFEKLKRYEDALHYLIERADDSNDARYGTLSASFVRDVCSKALEGTE